MSDKKSNIHDLEQLKDYGYYSTSTSDINSIIEKLYDFRWF
jgi:hypothetical protein